MGRLVLRNKGTAEKNVHVCMCVSVHVSLHVDMCVVCVHVYVSCVHVCIYLYVYVCKEKFRDDTIIPTTLFHPNQVFCMCH